MRSKAPLALMEQIVMVVVFALAAALCLRAFALSDRISRESEARDRAVLLAQNAAEVCKAGGGDWAYMESVLGGEAEQDGWRVLYGETLEPVAADAAFVVVVQPEAAGVPGMGQAAVSVFDGDGQLLFRLSVGWQEEVRYG